MMSLRTKYAVLKATTIVLGALSIPWSTFVGFCFGEGRYFTGVVALCIQTAVALIDGYIWFWVLENMRIKIQAGANNQADGATASKTRKPVAKELVTTQSN
ncbi:MAG: hypothetical protein HXY36_03735 [Chloroflexi bacterium]|nr:hypothetical protein [Chloroflexota bacterium]